MSASNPNKEHETPVQPSLQTLFANYLRQQAENHASGLAALDPNGEVVPYDVGPVQPIDARPAWTDGRRYSVRVPSGGQSICSAASSRSFIV